MDSCAGILGEAASFVKESGWHFPAAMLESRRPVRLPRDWKSLAKGTKAPQGLAERIGVPAAEAASHLQPVNSIHRIRFPSG